MDDNTLICVITDKLARAAAKNKLGEEMKKFETLILNAGARLKSSDMPITLSQSRTLDDGVNLDLR